MNIVFGKYCTAFHGCLVVAYLQRIKSLVFVSVCISEHILWLIVRSVCWVILSIIFTNLKYHFFAVHFYVWPVFQPPWQTEIYSCTEFVSHIAKWTYWCRQNHGK